MKLTPEEHEHILSRRAAAKALEESTKVVQAMLDRALSLPFDEALPLIRKCMSSDYKLIWTDALAKWCATHHKEIAIIVEDKK